MDDVRVLVVGPSPGLAQDLLLAFRRRPGVKIFGPVPDAESAHKATQTGSVDVAVVEVGCNDVAVFDLVRSLAARTPVLVARLEDESALVDALTAGARGALPQNLESAVLFDAFQRASRGELVVPDHLLPPLVARLVPPRPIRCAAALTGREVEVLRLVAEGCSTPDLAVRLGISEATVQSHVKSMLAKLGVHSKMEAVRMAWREGLARVPVSA